MTIHTGRKTPHAVADNIYGGKSVDVIWAECFDNDDENAKTIHKYISKSNCYVKAKCQETPDDKFRETDVRKVHTAVWNQKSANQKKYGVFKTNYEIKEQVERASLDNVLVDN